MGTWTCQGLKVLGGYGSGGGMHYPMNSMFGGGFLFYALIAIVVVGVGLILAVKFSGRDNPTPPVPPQSASRTPLDILKERYAKGEITREQFMEAKKDLQD